MWWISGETLHVFADLAVTQQGLKPELGLEGVKETKESCSGGDWWVMEGVDIGLK